MGLFDSLLNKGAKMLKNVAAEAIEDVADEIMNGLKDVNGEKVTTTTSSARKNVYQAAKVPVGYEDLEGATVDEKLRAIFAREFPQYEIKEQVSPTTLGGTGNFMPYDFGVYENGQPKLFIMVVYNNTCRQRLYRWSKEEAQRAGVTMINFVYLFENEIEYMINRLHQYL